MRRSEEISKYGSYPCRLWAHYLLVASVYFVQAGAVHDIASGIMRQNLSVRLYSTRALDGVYTYAGPDSREEIMY